ncbi:methylenetetrahydrofolate reductase [Murimonas intestini]|uniref:Methylenetetrahydrofolate reductase n=1 Tax=Murimonas intestini TaxID=1337051 RepID=A0AB73SXF6_9FIRM|nr:methylenetetrahydrofolate reductase [Murimonas intestini]MCR1838729.1 methylenetetrahydrofolate reductase [Murimonas intestini]MCR1864029.1 methylenetetrahydrofolate reductase [Murimonas intestini]MCR1881639.1 methylenetetrahydrofolate reductase [Murimonas intestini]
MKSIVEVMKERTSFSFEVFPPKAEQPMEPLLECLNELYKFDPDFISCTYGAGGSNAGRNSEICKAIADSGHRAVTHFTCIGNTKDKVKAELQAYLDNGVDHILALRGDLPAGWEGTRGDFNYANELVAYIREQFGDKFTIAMAGDPEKHIQCPTFEEDIAHLKMKQDAGADYIMTQLCFDIEAFKRWYDSIRKAGITLPVDVGVMPVLNKDATIRMALSMNGCSIPRDLAEVISKHYNDPEGFKAAGIEYTVHQLYQFIGMGVDGIHLYALNKSAAVSEILTKSGLRAKKD